MTYFLTLLKKEVIISFTDAILFQLILIIIREIS